MNVYQGLALLGLVTLRTAWEREQKEQTKHESEAILFMQEYVQSA